MQEAGDRLFGIAVAAFELKEGTEFKLMAQPNSLGCT
jgi:hypothetical protein